jgi:hypothetical protein
MEPNDLLERGAERLDALQSRGRQMAATLTQNRLAVCRDLSIVSAVLLTGLIVFIAPDDVYWPVVYYLGLVALASALVAAGCAMRAAVASESRRLDAHAADQSRFAEAMRAYQISPSPENRAEFAARFASVPDADRKPGWFERNGDRLAFWLFFLGLVASILGLYVNPPARFGGAEEPEEAVMTTSLHQTTGGGAA